MSGTPAGQLATFMARYTVEIERTAKAALARVRAPAPDAAELFYDNYSAPAIARSPRRLIIKSISLKQRPRRPS